MFSFWFKCIEDEHDVVWFWLEKGKPHECPVCSQYFKVTYHAFLPSFRSGIYEAKCYGMIRSSYSDLSSICIYSLKLLALEVLHTVMKTMFIINQVFVFSWRIEVLSIIEEIISYIEYSTLFFFFFFSDFCPLSYIDVEVSASIFNWVGKF